MSPNFIPADSNRSSGYGFMKTPGAIDIAAVQALYGANMQTATGDNTYELPTANVAGVGWTTIWDAGGIDTISAANSTKPVSINLKAASLDASDPNGGGYFSRQINVYGGFSIAKGVVIENATGGSSNDLLVGNEAANRLSGGAGDDTYYIGRGDTVVDSSGRDTVYASFAFSDSAIENVFVNHVAVKGGGQLIRGTSGRNTLNGTAGNDILSGGQGNDRLKGFDGHDVFLFNTKPSASNIDKIMDFSVAEDTIQLSKSIFNHVQSSKGILKKSAFWKGSAAHDSNDHIIYDSARGALYYDPDGKGGEAAIKFATITPRLNMTADDFVLI